MSFLNPFSRRSAPPRVPEAPKPRWITATIDDEGSIMVEVETTRGTERCITKLTANAVDGADHAVALSEVISKAVSAADKYEAAAG